MDHAVSGEIKAGINETWGEQDAEALSLATGASRHTCHWNPRWKSFTFQDSSSHSTVPPTIPPGQQAAHTQTRRARAGFSACASLRPLSDEATLQSAGRSVSGSLHERIKTSQGKNATGNRVPTCLPKSLVPVAAGLAALAFLLHTTSQTWSWILSQHRRPLG